MRIMSVALALLAVGCRVPPVQLGADSATGQSMTKRDEYAEKIVRMKRQPLTFIAPDGSRCRVDEETWRGTEVGERATCVWQFAQTR